LTRVLSTIDDYHIDTQTHRHTDTQTHRHADIQTHRDTDPREVSVDESSPCNR